MPEDLLGLGDGPVLVYLGRVQPENRVDLLITGFATVLSSYSTCKLVIIGEAEAEKHKLSVLAESLGVADNVIWAGAIYNERELAPWMMASDLFVYPCNVGLSLIHAFNYGLPAILCEPLAQHNPEVAVVEVDKNAVLASTQSGDALSDAIDKVLQNEDFKDRLGNRALASVKSSHNISAMVAEFVRLIHKLGEAS